MAQKNFKVATFNVNSLRTRLRLVLDWLDREKPDVLALQETKVRDEDFPREEFAAQGWRAAFKGQKSYNGVALISRETLERVETAMDGKAAEAEARFITGEIRGVRIFNTYIPQGFEIGAPQYQKKLKFFADLKKYFSRRVKPSDRALWVGDLNVAREEIDLARPKANREHVCFHVGARNALSGTMGGLWTDLFREREKGPGHYTFWSMRYGAATFRNNVGWRVDLILGTRAMLPLLRRVRIDHKARSLAGASDHTYVVAEFSL